MTLREYIEFKLIDTEKIDITIYHLIVIAIILADIRKSLIR